MYVQARKEAKKGISAFKADVEEKFRKVRVLHARVYADLRRKVAWSPTHRPTARVSACELLYVELLFLMSEKLSKVGKRVHVHCAAMHDYPLGIRLQFKLLNGVL